MATSVNTFDFIPISQRNMYETAFDAITQLELWPFMKQFNDDSFMFSNGPEIDAIYKKIEEFGYFGHSGCSFGLTMRTMQYISIYGLATFEEKYTGQKA